MSAARALSWSSKRPESQPTNFQAYERAGSMVRQFYSRPAIKAAANLPPVFLTLRGMSVPH